MDDLQAMEDVERKCTIVELLRGPQPWPYDAADAYVLRFSNSYTRLDYVFEIKGYVARADWLRLLGKWWPSTDNVYAYIPEIKAAIEKKRPVLEMMNSDEIAAFGSLRERLSVYRACGDHNRDGICWSLDANVAMRFPFLNRYKVAEPLLITGAVDRTNVVALKLDRDETEIISFDVEPHKCERLALVSGQIKRTTLTPS